jgi:hypothetical protein
MTIEENLRAIVREEMRPVEVKLSLVASLLQQLCREMDGCRTTFTPHTTGTVVSLISECERR